MTPQQDGLSTALLEDEGRSWTGEKPRYPVGLGEPGSRGPLLAHWNGMGLLLEDVQLEAEGHCGGRVDR